MDIKSVLFFVLCAANLLYFAIDSSRDKEKSLSTSMADMVELLAIETELIDSVDRYAAILQQKVDTLKNLVKEMKEENEKSHKSPEEYLCNPLNAFSLIRRMHNDWPKIELFITEPVGEAELEVLRKYRLDMPTATDLAEASEGLNRMQIVYDLKASDMVDGILNGKQYDVKMKSIDAYFMGHYLYTKNQSYAASFWLYVAVMKYETNEFNRIVDYGKEKPLELYAETLMHQNRINEAILPLQQAVELRPYDVRRVSRLNEIQHRANVFNGEPIQPIPPVFTTHEKGCRGLFPNRTSKTHVCIYNTTTTAFLHLAPLKMEIVHLNPYMVLYHDVMTDSEIEHIKKLARPKLKRAHVFKENHSGTKVSNIRTSKSAWLQDDTDEVTKRINTRIADMTGFDMQGSEMLQIGNYGLGGHYYYHFDFFNVTDDTPLVIKEGDRIATVLFYLSDVEQGGATVFPNIETTVFPRKGTAVLWYNLNNALKGDYLTLHAACPVIVGSKWVCNKWIRSKAQMFRRPCYK